LVKVSDLAPPYTHQDVLSKIALSLGFLKCQIFILSFFINHRKLKLEKYVQ
jgi:hypothetical protein